MLGAIGLPNSSSAGGYAMWSRFIEAWSGHPRYAYRGRGAAYVLMVVVAFVGGEMMYRAPSAPRSSASGWMWAATTIVMVGILIALTVRRGRVRSRVRAAGGCLCTECGYSLAGLGDAGECPECGAPYAMEDVRAAWAAWK